MALFIVVHHPDDPHQMWANEWDGDMLLKSITTPRAVANRLTTAAARGERVYVHRCAYGGREAVICCSCTVDSVQPITKKDALVRFADVRAESGVPPQAARPGLNTYEAPIPATSRP